MLKKRPADFEVVWVSHDRTLDEFVQYFQSMPWLALPADRATERGSALSSLFGVQGLPALVLLDASHPLHRPVLISTQGVSLLAEDPYALRFPYRGVKVLVPREIREFMQEKRDRLVAMVKDVSRGAAAKMRPSSLLKAFTRALQELLRVFFSLLFPQGASKSSGSSHEL